MKLDDYQRDLINWKNLTDKLNEENCDLKRIIDDLENKNR